MFGRYYPAASDAPFCICLHGLTRNSRDFEDFAPQLALEGYRVLALDMRGRGESDYAKDPSRYQLATYLADCLAWLDTFDVERAIWIGSSMGGGIGMMAGALHPERVAALILNDIGPEVDAKGVANIARIAGKGKPIQSWKDAAQRCRDVNGHVHPDEMSEAFWLAFARRTHRQEGPQRFRSDYDPAVLTMLGGGAPAKERWNAFDLLQEIPTLLVRGALSELLTREIATRMRARHAKMKLVEVPRTGHTPLLTEKIAFDAILSFLAALRFS